MENDPRSGVAARKVEATAGSGFFLNFFFKTLQADFHFSADIQYFSQNDQYVLVWSGIWSGMKQSCFCSGLSTGMVEIYSTNT